MLTGKDVTPMTKAKSKTKKIILLVIAALAAAAGYAVPLIPASPQVLDGARLALTVVERVSTVILGCSVIGVVLCVIRKIVGR